MGKIVHPIGIAELLNPRILLKTNHKKSKPFNLKQFIALTPIKAFSATLATKAQFKNTSLITLQ